MGNTRNTGYLQNIVQYDASNNITLPANLTVTGSITGYATTSYVGTQLGGYVPTTRTISINGTSLDLSTNRSFTINSMVYPGAGIAVSTGSAWGTSLTDNSANWNTAYSWGNHAGLYSLLNHTHTFASLTSKPTTLVGYGITDAAISAQGTKADTAFGWGNHAIAGYLTGITSGQVTTALGFTPYNATNPSNYITTAALSTYATQTYVGTAIANLVASAPAALDTLNELATALGNDAAFSTTVSTALGNRLRVDINTQGLSATLQGYGRTNLGLGTAATSNTGDFVAYRTFGTAANSATGDFVAYRTFGTAANNNTGDFALASHTHSIANVTGLQTALDGKIGLTGLSFVAGSGAYNNTTGVITIPTNNTQITNGSNYITLGSLSFAAGSGAYNSTTGVITIPTNNNQITNGAGYITSYTETDTLASVTGRGATTSTAVSFTGGLTVGTSTVDSNFPFYVTGATTTSRYSLTNMGMGFNVADSYAQLQLYGTSGAYIDFQVSASQDYAGRILYTSASGFNISAATTFASTISASNYSGTHSGSSSGTNTGDQTNISGNAATTSYIYNPNYNTNTSNVMFNSPGSYYVGLVGNVANSLSIVTYTNPSGAAANAIASYALLHTGNYTSYAVPTSRTLTINGTAYDLTADRSWTVSATTVTGNAGSATLLKSINTTSSVLSNWNPQSLTYQAWGQAWGHSSISADTGDLVLWLRASQYVGSGTEVCMMIDGDYYAGSGAQKVWHAGNLTNNNQLTNGAGYITGSGSISGNAATATYLKSPFPYNINITDATTAQSLSDGSLTSVNMHASHGLFTSWATTLTMSGYDRYGVYQISGNYNATVPELAMRNYNQSISGYTAWTRILSSANYSSYALPLSGGSVTGDVTFGNNSTSDQGIRINYGNYASGYGRIRFHQDGTNHSTIHSFSASWQSGSAYGNSTGCLNLDGQNGITLGPWNAHYAAVTSEGIAIKASATPSGAKAWNANSVLRLQQGSTGDNVYLEMRNRADVGSHAAILFTDNNTGGYIGFKTYVGSGANNGYNGDYMVYGTYTDHIFQAGSSEVFDGKTEVFRISANGSVRATGDITAYSDRRVKENIITIDNALEKTLQLRGVFYNRTDKDDKSQKVGVIAQEIQEVLPQVVNEDYNGLLSVSYGNITGLLIEAVKEQQTQIESQKSEIEELKDLVQQLINR